MSFWPPDAEKPRWTSSFFFFCCPLNICHPSIKYSAWHRSGSTVSPRSGCTFKVGHPDPLPFRSRQSHFTPALLCELYLTSPDFIRVNGHTRKQEVTLTYRNINTSLPEWPQIIPLPHCIKVIPMCSHRNSLQGRTCPVRGVRLGAFNAHNTYGYGLAGNN